VYVCLCNRVTDRQVKAQAARGDCTLSSIHRSLGVTPKCGKCLPMMRDIVRSHAEPAGCAGGV
jgi:bacterioferritin-associated ferredoxin